MAILVIMGEITGRGRLFFFVLRFEDDIENGYDDAHAQQDITDQTVILEEHPGDDEGKGNPCQGTEALPFGGTSDEKHESHDRHKGQDGND